jgi:aspartate/methionine/tyrosine aminotransferase
MRVRGSVYMRWAKEHAAARYNLANSGLLGCGPEDLELSPADLQVNGPNLDGFRPLLEAIAARYGARPEQVATAAGTSGANFLAFAALVEPGDEVLIEQPTYEPLLAALSWLGARLRRFQRRFEDGYRWDPDEVRDRLDAAGGRRIRLVVLTNPHNPSGVLAPAAEVAEVGRLAERAGALVLVDEVYRDGWDDNEEGDEAGAAPPEAGPLPASHLHLGPNFLTTSSLTKCYGLSGLRCGWALGPPELVERLRRVDDFMAATHPMPSDALALAAFRQLPRLAARARAIVDPNRRLVRAFLDQHREWLAAVLPAHAMMAFPRLLREDDSQQLHDRLRRLETSIVPGRFFDHPRHFRLGFAVRHEDVEEGLRRLSQALRDT